MKNRKLVALRGAKTLLEVATDLEISVSALSQYENGKRFPIPEIAMRIADYFDITVDELFYGDSFTRCKKESEHAQTHTIRQGVDAV
ncbi:helix-turn-helix domain-containing protein [Tumebacillus flagellatus]|uniref:HTH cro/C1-type domain-containing protein n=1 Tax=Tumebacillus flagellatus TaxID=1157490 RepID=A0A074MGF2_9BACL|nr:helix-turn-helix transcriptional regulator [Tumebacillus flagellatus]KEO84792.1 hypothetical protein EL26_01925 [Tumebacillus flagellatus]